VRSACGLTLETSVVLHVSIMFVSVRSQCVRSIARVFHIFPCFLKGIECMYVHNELPVVGGRVASLHFMCVHVDSVCSFHCISQANVFVSICVFLYDFQEMPLCVCVCVFC
jgi:hypothetical protein